MYSDKFSKKVAFVKRRKSEGSGPETTRSEARVKEDFFNITTSERKTAYY